MRRWPYGATIGDFLDADPDAIIGALVNGADFPVETSQRNAWQQQIVILKDVLTDCGGRGAVYFEYAIPRLGKRVDTVLILNHVLFVLEFKVGEQQHKSSARDQTWDYALDLKNFHEPSHTIPIAPVLVATEANPAAFVVETTQHADQLLMPLPAGRANLRHVIDACLDFLEGPPIDVNAWQRGRYQPTPTIVEAAKALYAGHDVEDISRSDAGAENLGVTSRRVAEIIRTARSRQQKSICFVTGVPGAGKTLVGLDIATKHINKNDDLYSVFLSGNGPLVAVLREALARDEVAREAQRGEKLKLGEARSKVKMFIQNVHHFRDDCLADLDQAPIEHVALFDEAQRAWDLQQTANFMQRRKAVPGFDQSEPEFLISCLDRHEDWGVVVCLVGSGQEINTGEAGISEWLSAIQRRFPDWNVHLSPRLTEIEYHAQPSLEALSTRAHVHYDDSLHLATSVRSFRSEYVSTFVNQFLALELEGAEATLQKLLPTYPIRLTRDLSHAKQWLRRCARGSERYGMIVSSQAQRLKPHAIDVRVKVNPVHWFLNDKDDTRSSYFLEDVATEFQIQGLELDWSCVVWDGDLRLADGVWDFHGFVGKRWQRILKEERRRYLLNAYRVLLTRARQGLVIVVPEGDDTDPSRNSAHYDPVFRQLDELGIPTL
ncbi:DUF2075 domain-containing protein [Wenzhouxiangella sp. XN201]|nr:DUF2075 domain-containing protein [Wenzhouxiangella sp. XN201]